MSKKLCLLAVFTLSVSAQTTQNPDFSVIGQVLLEASDDSSALHASDLELAIQGYVNPYARAEVYLHKHDASGSFQLEEATLTIERGLPLGLAARLGKIRPDFGKLNRQHAHVWPFITAPVGIAAYGGDELWSATGAEINALLPLPWYARLSLGAFTEGMSAEDHDHTESDEHTHTSETTSAAYSGRLSHFFEMGTHSHLELGTSYYRQPDTEAVLLGLDYKFKWRPDTYRGLTIQAEFLQDHGSGDHEAEGEEELHDELPEWTGYAFANYQFNRKWNLGFIVNALKHHEETPALTPGLFFGFSPVEESLVTRIVLRDVTRDDHESPQLLCQLIWSLGPHKPHQF